LKEVHRCQDIEGMELGLHYIRTKDGREIDFLVTRDKRPRQLIEVKWTDASLSPNLSRFLSDESLARVQVVGELAQSKSYPGGERIEAAQEFLANLSLENL
jgi:hypothetical protein